MAETYIARKEDLTAVANEIRSKGKTSEKLVFPHGFEGAIRAIQVRDEEEKDITFHDYDGTLLYEYTIEEAQLLTSLPPAPEHEGLIFDGWNWSLEDVRELTYPMRIGANYITDDGATRLYMHFTDPHLHTYLRWQQNVSNGVTIDWGDGSAHETFEGVNTNNAVTTAEHTYPEAGDYVIRMMPDDDCTLTLYGGTHMYCIIGWRRAATTVYAYSHRLTRVELGKNLGVTKGYAFMDCKHLESISIPRYMMFNTNNSNFSSCVSLKGIVLPPGMDKGIDFYNCHRLEAPCLPKGITTPGSFNACKGLRKVTLPEGITTIGGNTFNQDYCLKRIRIPSTVTSIGDAIFQNCHGLHNMPEWPQGMNIPTSTFNQAESLTGDIVIRDGVTSIGNSAFRNTSIRSIILPNSVESIGNSAFQGTLLTEFEWPTSIKTVGTYMFYGCNEIRKMRFPDNIAVIPSNFCYNCWSIEELYIPEGVTTIDASAFQGCTGLTYIEIPSSVTTINASAFNGANGVIEYHFRSETPPTLANTNVFNGIAKETIIYVPAGCLEAYQTATNWSAYASYLREEGSV